MGFKVSKKNYFYQYLVIHVFEKFCARHMSRLGLFLYDRYRSILVNFDQFMMIYVSCLVNKLLSGYQLTYV